MSVSWRIDFVWKNVGTRKPFNAIYFNHIEETMSKISDAKRISEVIQKYQSEILDEWAANLKRQEIRPDAAAEEATCLRAAPQTALRGDGER
jgi:monomeric isocitrate dehydrogenase